ncbi:ankyrin repeat and LEM domain-containing protein 2-like [Branchiostoma lanceolatum]|uniref:ankyrin repeat and LEM domain-containing protein 2-like n=1 Tax=Branchiostoma lanceolatum TaxID=7740 RepID=UPI003453C1A8
MEAILQDLHKLSIAELRQKLKEEGQPMGPITSTTRLLFEKRLAQALYSKNNPEHSGEDVPDSSQDAGSNDTSIETNSTNVTLSQPAVTSSSTDGSSISADRGGEELAQVQVEEEEEGETTYYAVSLPPSEVSLAAHANGLDPDQPHVYTKRSEALTTLKKIKGARFKAFKNRKDADDFSLQKTPPVPVQKPEVEAEATKGEKANNFKAPKVPELNRLRKSFEQGDKVTFLETVWNNPRFLISSGDTPVILQEGSRWSALHVAAKANLPNMCDLVLDTLQDHEFLQLMYPGDDPATETRRQKFLVDLYLNTPDKGNCETPLHFACKFGHVDVVRVLVSHPSLDRTIKNRYDQTARDIICSRCQDGPTSKRAEQIRKLLEESYFVPLFRAEDNCLQPLVGEPWSPDPSGSPVLPLRHSQGSPVAVTPPRGNMAANPASPTMRVAAVAGPMSPAEATRFHQKWKTPPHSPDFMHVHNIRRGDNDRGLERIGREMARDLHIPWKEKWDFLKINLDLATDEGLDKLEEYFAKKNKSFEDENNKAVPNPSPVVPSPPNIASPCRESKVNFLPPECNSISMAAYYLQDEESDDDTLCPNTPNTKVTVDKSSPCATADTEEELDVADRDAIIMEKIQKNPFSPLLKDSSSSDIDSYLSWRESLGEATDLTNTDEPEDNLSTFFARLAVKSPSPKKGTAVPGSGKGSAKIKGVSSIDVCTPCRKGGPPKPFFIDGDQPTKLDLDVFHALQGVAIPADKYPNIARWKVVITSYTEQARQSWPSPAGLQRQRRHTFSTRSPLAAPSMMTGSQPRQCHREKTDSVIDDLKQELFRGESLN